MTTRCSTFSSALMLTAVTFLTTECLAQVDPAWLRSWNESNAQRPATLTSSGRIAPEQEPGIPLVIHGQVVDPDGGRASSVVVHAYHRDDAGFDFGPNDSSTTTWRLQGWAVTDAEGRFQFRTIRPAADHLGREGAHIHFTLDAPGFGRQWAPKVFFSDDPLVTPDQRQRSAQDPEFGWVLESRTIDGVQHIDVNIRLRDRGDF